ncbi:MAG: type II toxin-antitoxin system VapC family toxin [Burkholderiales bacterium]|nr:type II toxin-antitoxin system VapC family toxin [Burkholderiales bacterium]
MISIDTNILVRLITRDDENQAQRAAKLFEHNQIFLCKTVLLETEWVLRFCYELSRSAILNALKNTVGLSQLTVEDSPAVAKALTLFENGMDFADALHLASGQNAPQFATFDERLKKRVHGIADKHRIFLV